MRDITTTDIIARAQPSHIDDDIVLVDSLATLRLPVETSRMQCLFFALCLEGTAQYTVDTVPQTVEAGDVIIIGNGQTVSDAYVSPDCRGVVILIGDGFFNEVVKDVHELSQLFLFAHDYPVYRLTDEEMTDAMKYYSHMKIKADETTHHFRREVVRSLFTTLIYDLSNAIYRVIHSRTIRHTRSESIFIDFIRLVEQNFRSERRVGWYSEQLCISAKYLSDTVKQISRRTPNEWIDNYVVLESRVLLRNSSKSIKEIAQELNFSNQSFFGKFFKEHAGMSPQAYRRAPV